MRPAYQKLALVAASVLVALGLGEALVRALDLAPRVAFSAASGYRLSDDPRLGYEPVPGTPVEREWTRGIETRNAHGFRDVERREARTPGVLRVIVLGDSIAAGYRVERREQTFPAVLERYLEAAGIPAEVLNFGVNGYNTMQEIALLEARGLDFSPDLVLVAFCLNDIERSDGQLLDALLARESGAGAGWNRRLATSALYRLLRHRLGAAEPAVPDHVRKRYAELYENTVPESLERLARLSRRHGFGAAVVVFPWFRDLMQPESELAPVRQAVADLSRSLGLDHLDLRPSFRACRAAGATRLAIDPLHPNAAGHRCAAEAIGRFVEGRYGKR